MTGPLHPPASARSGARLLVAVDRLLSRLEIALLAVGCVLIVGVMLLVAADALARYAFDSPIGFTFDLVSMYLMPATLFFALAFTLRRGGHVNVDLFVDFVPTRARHLLVGLLVTAALPIVYLIVSEGAAKTYAAWAAGDVTTGVYEWPIWLSEIIVPIGFSLLAARMTHVAIANIYAAVTDDHSAAIPISPPRNAVSEDAV